jgi:hypothetical protein|tara:strand:- start:216 stop:380 length:165 start_codon:yes stop_codon:yes gene_type:complete
MNSTLGKRMKNLIFILATSMIVLAGCGSDTAAVAAAAPVNGYVTPAGINAVPSQ